ncbi:Dpc25p NDAI_0E02580 [Naumovozyma dairenensis CBS 421]|uniref:Oxidoreductase-like domain-containing protein n=1 Tax=Naumovozyma dairenensis (strain ATCC 10597 / BCRC 20456 / CBS 421 / NBRC 0211 / NRRL Y-12639) TaxID=1071378 RepID=G0WBF5_NAUDC|nr:hypothetical protein NDAI_0E02580 [Naumovozyma dairenensis CBS 421]CCD25075.1 hypothetical protein NDAI_0E02580 [Naumovozyma dairenensis CBS 421]
MLLKPTLLRFSQYNNDLRLCRLKVPILQMRCIVQTVTPKMTFEGNTEGISTSEEAQMSRIFGGRIKGEAPKSTSRILTGGTRNIAGVKVPEKPIAPDNCCMSGCVNCVWEIYNEDIRYWKKKRREAADKIKLTHEVWPARWNPPLGLLEMKNVPRSLRETKLNYDRQKAEQVEKTPSDLFTKRDTPLPKAVIEAKKRHIKERATKNKMKEQESGEKIVNKIDDDTEGWAGVPVYIKVFAEFESRQRDKKIRKS